MAQIMLCRNQTPSKRKSSAVQRHTVELASLNRYASPRDRRVKVSRRAGENESARRYRLLVEHASEIIFETDANGNFVFFNSEAAFRILQYSQEELLGRHYLSLVRPDWREKVENFYREQLREKTEVTYFEFPVLAKDRVEVWFGQSLRLVHEGGELVAQQAFCRDITENRRKQHELERSQEQLRELSSRLEAAREAERTKIAREIHDELGTLLTLMKLDLRWCALELDMGIGGEKLTPIIQLVDSAIASVQRISTQLRPSILDQLGLVAAIEWQAKEFEARLGIPCKLEINAHTPRVEQERATAIFRVLQETLTNVARHAQASEVDIRLETTEDTVTLEVRDDGRGIIEEQILSADSIGLRGMYERARHFGGRFHISGAQSGGTIASLYIPLETAP